MASHILLVEGPRSGARSWAEALTKKGYTVTVAHTRRATRAQLRDLTPDLVIFDCRFLRFEALRLCRNLRDEETNLPLLVLLRERERAERGAGVNVYLREPFTARKLINRVKRLLPAQSDNVLRAGPLVLDLAQRTVSRGRTNHRLTPKQTSLLEVFLRHPGQVLTRSFLMKQVWETDFVDDTRTLEVHIHWLRRTIEENPSRPVYLTTVRGIGYRFDIPPETADDEPQSP
jgi:DNA-binding response OmpR family regulator